MAATTGLEEELKPLLHGFEDRDLDAEVEAVFEELALQRLEAWAHALLGVVGEEA